MRYYECLIDNAGVVYSLDMVTVSFKMVYGANDDFVMWLSELNLKADELDIQHYVSVKPFAYRDMFTVTLRDCSFVIGLGFNNIEKTEHKSGFVKFNPNKVMWCNQFREIYGKLMFYAQKVELKRYDMAFDFPVERKNVKLVTDRRNYCLIKSHGGVTEYLGCRGNSGRVKLYDKTRESNLTQDITRLEITMDLQTHIEDVFPTVYITDSQYSFFDDDEGNLKDTDLVLLELLQGVDNPNYYLNKLGRVKREKLKKYLISDRQYIYDRKLVSMIYMQACGYADRCQMLEDFSR